MVPEPSVTEGVVHQVNTIPPWLLPLWANWPMVVLGLVVILIMLVAMFRLAPRIQWRLQALDSKMSVIVDQVGDYRTKTMQELQGLRSDVQSLNGRVVLLEEKSPEERS